MRPMSMVRRYRLMVLALMLLLAACEFVPAHDSTPVLNVQCYLPVADTLRLLSRVNRTYAIAEPPALDFAGAKVVISRGSDTVRLDYTTGDRYVSALPIPVRYGESFELTVTHPEFDTVRGRTIVPDPFSIVAPAAGDTVTARDSLVWSISPSSRGYYIMVQAAPPEEFELEFLYPNDTLELNLPLFILNQAPAGHYSLTIVALDSNYYDWLRRYVGGPGGRNTSDSFNLSGGVGVFGSGVERSLEFCLRCDSAGPGPGPYGPMRTDVDNRPKLNIIYPR